MRKILAVIIILLGCCLCYAQTADINILVGAPGGENDTLDIGIGGWQEIPVYIQSNSPDTLYIGSLTYALGINNGYLENFDSTLITAEHPLSEFHFQIWDNLNEDWYIDEDENTWDSFTFFGVRWYEDPHFYLVPGDDPQRILTFYCQADYIPSFLDSIVIDAIGSGFDPVMHLSNQICDTTGFICYNVDTTYSKVRFFKHDGLITGTILNADSEPIESAHLISVNSPHESYTDENGEFTIISLVEDTYVFQLSHPDYDLTSQLIHVQSNDTVNVEIVMQRRGAISGIVTDIDNIPIEGASVTIVGLGISDTTNASGEYMFSNLLSGSYDLVIFRNDYLRTNRDNIRVFSPDTNEVNITLLQCDIAFDDEQIHSWVGGSFNGCEWYDTITFFPGQWLEIPIYLLGLPEQVAIGAFIYPLAINNAYIDTITSGDPMAYGAIASFEIVTSDHYNEDWQTDSLGNTWDSYAIWGIYENSPPYCCHDPLIFSEGTPPEHCLSFKVHFRDDIEVTDEIITDALEIGGNPFQENGYMSDTTGAVIYSITHNISVLKFPSLQFIPGDINMAVGNWPPQPGLSDVTYLVNYFRAMPSSVPCFLDGFWASADVNGDCQIIGSDVTFIVNYFRALNDLYFCPDYAPMWSSSSDIPTVRPDGWPYCE